jgi:hypothetical protein
MSHRYEHDPGTIETNLDRILEPKSPAIMTGPSSHQDQARHTASPTTASAASTLPDSPAPNRTGPAEAGALRVFPASVLCWYYVAAGSFPAQLCSCR